MKDVNKNYRSEIQRKIDKVFNEDRVSPRIKASGDRVKDLIILHKLHKYLGVAEKDSLYGDEIEKEFTNKGITIELMDELEEL